MNGLGAYTYVPVLNVDFGECLDQTLAKGPNAYTTHLLSRVTEGRRDNSSDIFVSAWLLIRFLRRQFLKEKHIYSYYPVYYELGDGRHANKPIPDYRASSFLSFPVPVRVVGCSLEL